MWGSDSASLSFNNPFIRAENLSASVDGFSVYPVSLILSLVI